MQRFEMHAEIFFLQYFIFTILDISQFAKRSTSINALMYGKFYHI